MATADYSAVDLSPGSLPKRMTIACAREGRCRSHSRLIPSRKRRTAFKADAASDLSALPHRPTRVSPPADKSNQYSE